MAGEYGLTNEQRRRQSRILHRHIELQQQHQQQHFRMGRHFRASRQLSLDNPLKALTLCFAASLGIALLVEHVLILQVASLGETGWVVHDVISPLQRHLANGMATLVKLWAFAMIFWRYAREESHLAYATLASFSLLEFLVFWLAFCFVLPPASAAPEALLVVGFSGSFAGALMWFFVWMWQR